MTSPSPRLLCLVLASACAPAQTMKPAQPAPPAATPAPMPSIAAKTAGLRAFPGLFPLYWDDKEGKLLLEISEWQRELLYQSGLAAGVGSNDIGLDRGQLGPTRVVRFERIGPRVLLIQDNLDYRASGGSADERRSVKESFAESTLWGFTVVAQTGGRALVDATEFFLRDAHDIPATLKRTGQGAFHLEASRAALALDHTRGFPLNTEVEATLTFLGDEPGEWVQQVTPMPGAITVREHHSLVALPPPGFHRRAYDPRASFIDMSYQDYATPISEPIVQRWAIRHRLAKKDPRAAISEPVKPIVYYLDRGTPEPIRSALLEGARWWSQAFEAAGYRNAFRVEMLPEDADPMDLRYNVIQWVHRATRGWSYGASVIDPRTGEILKGHVTLGSLRVRQDYLIAEALLAPHAKGQPSSPRAQELALARLRQLAAHEVGHTLGLMHNFASSTVGRASVMDYPPPVVTLGADGKPDISAAYATGIGAWDKVAITWGYKDYPDGTDERAAGDQLLTQAFAAGQRFLTDQDARPPGSASSVAHLWDAGESAIDELGRLMAVRATTLARFGEASIREGTPLATLEDALVPLYMLHRYQVEAASKLIGGVDYSFALRGDGQVATRPVAPADQRRALTAVLATLTPAALALPEPLLALVPPRPPGYPRGREHFKIRTSPVFDALAPAEAAAQHTLSFLFSPERAARLIEQHARTPDSPGLDEVLAAIVAATWHARREPGLRGEIGRVVDQVVLVDLMALSRDDRASPQTRALAAAELARLQQWAAAASARTRDPSERAHLAYAGQQITDFEKDPKRFAPPPARLPPDGPPIGCGDPDEL
ncbi:MAG TPA: zinc-dependent metalloprotease [Kofleriaceae bacterium]|nr:zinc-dependent metalloprotease [Kofleriaceae bacterium]